MRIALTGASGLAGHPVGTALAAMGHQVVTLGRRPALPGADHVDWSLGETPKVACDALVHCAFHHAPGRYRGGEGDDPDSFLRLNRDGTLRLLDGVGDARVIFLSSRAAYGDHPPGTRLFETTGDRPETLYGRMKLETEAEVTARGGVSLRATGLYGPPPPGRAHKWKELFGQFADGEAIPPRAATELHVGDLAQAVAICVGQPTPPVLNVSDIVLDRHELLAAWSRVSGIVGPLPDHADKGAVNEMDCTRLRALGWRPRGRAGLVPALRALV